MALTQAIVATSSTKTLLNAVTTSTNTNYFNNTQYSWNNATLIIQNVTATSVDVFIGDVNLTTSAYGYKLAQNQSLTLNNLGPTEAVYAISASAASLAVISILR